MKTILLLITLLLLNGCVEFACYSNADYAVKEAQEFCKRADGNKNHCESLKIFGKNICSFGKYTENACRPLGDSIDTFVRILSPDCNHLEKKICREKPSCKWTFNDPLGQKYSDFR